MQSATRLKVGKHKFKTSTLTRVRKRKHAQIGKNTESLLAQLPKRKFWFVKIPVNGNGNEMEMEKESEYAFNSSYRNFGTGLTLVETDIEYG